MSQVVDAPESFRVALESLRDATTRKDVRLVETPAPQRIAAFAIAINGTVLAEETDTTGRFVLLHEPGGNDAWEGEFRVVALVKARVDAEVGADDLWADAAWSWLADALEDLPHHGLGGTVTKVINRSFGDLTKSDDDVSVELRVSWTPETADASAHLQAWTELMALCAGIPPTPEGVTALPGTRS